jgi:uncharacterized protein involved in exopolysaccharide biosynthesis
MMMEPVRREEQTLRELLRRIARRRRLLLIVGSSTFLLIAAWTFLATPRYESMAVLRIESKAAIPGLPEAVSDLPMGLAGLAKDELETDIGVLKSDRMTDATIDALGLSVQVVRPADDRARVIRVRVLDSSDVEGRLTFSRRDDGRYDVDADDLEDEGKLPPTLAPGDSMRVGSLMLTLPENLKAGGPSTIKLRLLPRYKVHERLEKRLTIQRQEGGSRLVEVSFEDPDRRLAAQVIDRLVSEYVAYMLRTDQREEGAQITELRGQLGATAARLASAEEQLRRFQQRARVVLPEEQADAQVKRIAMLDTRLDAIRIERNALARLLDLIRARSRGGSDPSAYRQLATFPSLIENRAIGDLLQALMDLESKRSALALTRTESNAELQQIIGRIAELDQQLYRLGSQYLESLDQQLSSTTRTVGSLNDTLNTLPGTAMQYTRLERDRTILSEEYLALYKQLKLAELQDVLRREKVKVVVAPHVASEDDPEFPKKGVQLALGLVLALLLAFAAGLGVELWSESDS